MARYLVTVYETLSCGVEVEANSATEAEDMVQEQYDNCEIVLSADNFESMHMEVEEVDDAEEG